MSMEENKKSVRLGEGVADGLKKSVNERMLELGQVTLDTVSEFIKKKIEGIDPDKLFSQKNKEELVKIWSDQLAQKGLIPQGYVGLPETLLIDDMHQDGYLSGMYVGYVLAMMALADNDASKDLVLAVRDDMRPNLMGQHYNNREEFFRRYKDEKYSWIEKLDKKEIPDK